MNISMFSCSHFSNFLSDPIRKQSAMSKGGQEATSSERSPMAKTKANESGDGEVETHVSGVAHPVECEEEPFQDLSDSVKPENAEEEQGGVPISIKKLKRITSRDPTEYSQVRRQENTRNADTWKQEDRDESSGSISARKPERAVHTRSDFQNMKITSYQYMTKVFRYQQKEVWNHNRLLTAWAGIPGLRVERSWDPCIDCSWFTWCRFCVVWHCQTSS